MVRRNGQSMTNVGETLRLSLGADLHALTSAFKCPQGFKHPWTQTVLADAISRFHSNSIPFTEVIVRLPDGDSLVCSVDTPEEWDQRRICVLLPGLTGHAESFYILRIAKKLLRLGYKTVRVNYRSCGRGLGHAKALFHAGQGEDIFCLLQKLYNRYPEADIQMLGFSLGGNMMLKMAGDFPAEHYGVTKMLAVSAPVDLVDAARTIMARGRFFDRYFSKRLLAFLNRVLEINPNIRCSKVPKKLKSIMDFDSQFVVPMFGFKDVMDYYHQSRAVNSLRDIGCKAGILLADDDPIVDYRAFQNPDVLGPVELYLTHGGGHVGFLRKGGLIGDPFWMDDFIVHWALKE